MRLLIVSAVFPPEPVTSARTSADLAHEMASRGHDVTVLAPYPNRPSGVLLPGTSRSWRRWRMEDGYRLEHCWHFLSRTSKLLSRMLENLSFGITSSLRLLSLGHYDLAYLNTWPIISQCLNVVVLRLKGIPVLCCVQDIYPESMTNKGILDSKSLLANAIRAIDGWVLRHSTRVSTLTPQMREYLIVNRRLSESLTLYFPNWLNSDEYSAALEKNGTFRKQHEIAPHQFVAMFAGSLTMSARPEMYVDVAARLAALGRQDIVIVLVGDGSMRIRLRELIRQKELNNIRVIFPLMQSDVPLVQAAADVLLLALSGNTTQNAAPSKQISYMFSGRPIVASITKGSTAAALINQAECGYVLPPDDADAVASLLCQISTNRNELEAMGKRGKRYAVENFSKTLVLPRLATFLERITSASNALHEKPISSPS